MPDSLPSASDLRRLTRRIAITIAVILAVAVPAQYAATSYYHKINVMEQVGYNATNALLRHVYLYPAIWEYQEHRLYELLNWALLDKTSMSIGIIDNQGKLLTQVGASIDTFSIDREFEVLDGSERVARIRVSRVAAPLLVETLVAALVGLLPAILFYVGLKVLPFRLLETAWGRLRAYQSQLNDQMAEKESALKRLRDAQERMEFLAMHDALTGLANRNLLKHQAELSLAKARRESRQVVLLLLNLGQFRRINEAQGHDVGDRVLRVIGHRLKRMLRDADVVARLGADEYAVLLANTDQTQAERLAERLRSLIQKPIATEAATVNLDASIGLSWFPQHANDYSTLLRNADLALREAKRQACSFKTYQEDLRSDPGDTTHLGPILLRAVAEQRFSIAYQPIVEIQDRRLVAVEALLRWQDERLGRIEPAEFIPLAERHEQIAPLTDWLLDSALAQLSRWAFLHPQLQLCVNLSAMLLRDENLPSRLLQIANRNGVSADRLCLEITEDGIMADPVAAKRGLAEIRAMGFHLAVDRFGAGCSSVANLAALDLDLLKIDAGFIGGMTTHAWATDVVNGALGLARGLGIKVLGTGVESLEQWRLLSEAGCDLAQGHVISPAVNAQELTHLISSDRLVLRDRSPSGAQRLPRPR